MGIEYKIHFLAELCWGRKKKGNEIMISTEQGIFTKDRIFNCCKTCRYRYLDLREYRCGKPGSEMYLNVVDANDTCRKYKKKKRQ